MLSSLVIFHIYNLFSVAFAGSCMSCCNVIQIDEFPHKGEVSTFKNVRVNSTDANYSPGFSGSYVVGISRFNTKQRLTLAKVSADEEVIQDIKSLNLNHYCSAAGCDGSSWKAVSNSTEPFWAVNLNFDFFDEQECSKFQKDFMNACLLVEAKEKI